MTKIQARAIIALLAVTILVGAIIAFALLRDDSPSAPTPVLESGTPTAQAPESTTSAQDPATVLEGAAVNSIHPAPAPEAPQKWGDYKLTATWDGQLRVFDTGGIQPVKGENGATFPATMNNCGIGMVFTTFRSVNNNVDVSTHLLNAIEESTTSAPINQGWMLSTNCETPAFEFLGSRDSSTLVDVAYTVHLYTQNSTAVAHEEQGAEVAPSPPAVTQTAAPKPTFVQCLGTLGPPMALYSDGSERNEPICEGSPERARASKGESVCGGLYGWQQVSETEYIELCGQAPPTGIPTPAGDANG